MDDSSSANLVAIVLLLAFNTLITLIYSALVNLRQSVLNEQIESGNRRARHIVKLLDSRSHLTITYHLSNVLLHSLIAGIATLQFVLPVLESDGTLGVIIGILLLLGIGAIIVVISDIVPEGIGSVYAEPIAHVMFPFMRTLVLVLSPVTIILLGISRFIASIFGGDKLINTVTEEEIMTLVKEGLSGGTIEDEEKEMIYSILQLDETYTRELMTPRPDIVALDVDASLEEAAQSFINTGFSRIPVYEENIDNIVGLLYAKDLLHLWLSGDNNRQMRDLVRSAYFVPETKAADELLKELQNRKVHMAIVVDEYGGTSGLVTIENLIEEIVGDIRDEYDVREEEEYIQLGEMEYIMDAGMDLDDINDMLEIHIDTDDTDTLGGLIYMHLGRVPEEGEVIETADLTLTVRSIEGRRIRKVHVLRKVSPEPGEETEESGEALRRDDDSDDSIEPLADAS